MEQKNNIKNKNVETYTGDMAKAIDGSEGMYIKKLILEQEHEEEENAELSEVNKKNKYFLFLGVFLIICAIISLVLIFVFKKDIFSVSVNQQFVPMIYLDDTEFKDIGGLNKDQISQITLNTIASKEIKNEGVLGVYFTLDKQIVGFRKFLTLISANLDQNQISFINDNFLIGATNIENKDLFILLKMRSMTDIFDPVRQWENKMFNDLHGFFGVNITPDTKYLLTKSFEDGIVQNKNARILYDEDRKIVMMYVFSDDTSLIIANSEVAVREVMLRLSSGIIRK